MTAVTKYIISCDKFNHLSRSLDIVANRAMQHFTNKFSVLNYVLTKKIFGAEPFSLASFGQVAR